MTSLNPLPLVAHLPAWWWTLLVACMAGFALLRVLVRMRPNAAREHALRACLAQCGPAESASEQASLERLYNAPHEADPRAPWYLLLGHRAANVPLLLSTARHANTMAAAGLWRWTAMRSMCAIAVDPAALETPQPPATRRAWCRALLTLAQQPRALPLNGIVVCMDAHQLQQAHDEVVADATRLRQCVDEVARLLGVRLPLYVVVTGLEALPGYDTVRDALPDEVRGQAVGHRSEKGARSSADEAIGTVFQRLHALRMALLWAQPGAPDRLAIHRFVEALRGTRAGLHALATVLFDPGGCAAPAQPFRGLYLTASGAAGGAFIDDLFERFLPADRPLAHAADTAPLTSVPHRTRRT